MPFRWRSSLEKHRAALRSRPWDVLGCALAMLYGTPTAWYPFGSDQGIHWYLGHRLLQGEMPYASGISGKPPLIFVVHAAAELLFGNHQSSIRILEILAIPFFGALIAKAVRVRDALARDGELGCAALLLSAANFTYQDYWNTAHPEFWMTLSSMGAWVIAVHAPPGRRRPLQIGALSMVAFLFKYPAAAVAIPIAAWAGFRALFTDGLRDGEPIARVPSKSRWLALLGEAAWFLAGAAAVFGAVLLPFVLTGTLREMFEVCVLMTENYAKEVELPRDWYRPLFDPLHQGTLFIATTPLFLAGVLTEVWRKRFDTLRLAAGLFALALAAIASVVLQKRLFTYHWIATYPFFVAMAVWGLRRCLAELRLTRLLSPALVVVALLLTVGAFSYRPEFITKVPHDYATHVARWWKVVRGEESREALTLSYRYKARADDFGDLVRASRAVLERAQPGDALCLTCFVSPVYQLTGMHCTSRHAIGTFVWMGPRYWSREYDAFLRDQHPRFVVSIHTYPKRNQQLRKFGYRETHRFGTLQVFEWFGAP